jgi:hypothetical protein
MQSLSDGNRPRRLRWCLRLGTNQPIPAYRLGKLWRKAPDSNRNRWLGGLPLDKRSLLLAASPSVS